MNYKRKIYKNVDVIFWFIVMALPLIVALIWFIGCKLTFNSGIASSTDMIAYQTSNLLDFGNILNNVLDYFDDLVFPFLKDMFIHLFDLIGVENHLILGVLFGWFCSVQFMHLLFDFICWLPKFADKYLHKCEE